MMILEERSSSSSPSLFLLLFCLNELCPALVSVKRTFREDKSINNSRQIRDSESLT